MHVAMLRTNLCIECFELKTMKFSISLGPLADNCLSGSAMVGQVQNNGSPGRFG